MASEPAWACVASSAFPLVYSYSKELTLGGQSSRALEKDHSKLIQALEQQLKVKGRSVANKAESLFFYSHFPFLTAMELDLVLLRLSEQFCAPTSSKSFRVAILALLRQLQVHFPNKSINDPSKVTTPFGQLAAQHDIVETRILALQALALLAPFSRDDAAAHTSILNAIGSTDAAEAAAAVETAAALLAHSPSFQQLAAQQLLPAALDLHVLPLLPWLSGSSPDVAIQQYTKCHDFLHRGVYIHDGGEVEFTSVRWSAPLLVTMTQLATAGPPSLLPRLMELFRSILAPPSANASLQRIVLRCCVLVVGPSTSSLTFQDLLRLVTDTIFPHAGSDDVDVDLLELLERYAHHHALPADLALPRMLFARHAPHATPVFARVLYNQARHELGDSDAAPSLAVACLVHLLSTVAPKTQPAVIRALEGLVSLHPVVATQLTAQLGQSLVDFDHERRPTTALWVFVSHLASICPLSDAVTAAIVAALPSTWAAHSKTALAMVVALLRSGFTADDFKQHGGAILPPVASVETYQVARECIVHGAFGIAADILADLTGQCTSERTGHWMDALAAWTTAESLFVSQPSIVPTDGLGHLQTAITSLQAAATSTTPMLFPQGFLAFRVGLATTLQSLFQHLFEVQIAGLGSPRRLADIAAQFLGHGATVASLGNAAWSHSDLYILAAHAHLCHVLHDTIHRFLVGPTNTASNGRVWPGTAADPHLATYSPLWQFCKGLDAELPRVPVPNTSRDAAALVVDLGRAALAVPCAIPRQFFRTTAAHVPSDIQIVSPSLKMMSRSVLGLAAHSSCVGHLHVTLDLQHVRRSSPLLCHKDRSWRLIFDGALDNGVGLVTHVAYADGLFGNARWQGALPLQVEAGRFGAQGTSCAIMGHLWLVDEANCERWLVADRALERTVVVY